MGKFYGGSGPISWDTTHITSPVETEVRDPSSLDAPADTTGSSERSFVGKRVGEGNILSTRHELYLAALGVGILAWCGNGAMGEAPLLWDSCKVKRSRSRLLTTSYPSRPQKESGHACSAPWHPKAPRPHHCMKGTPVHHSPCHMFRQGGASHTLTAWPTLPLVHPTSSIQ